MLLVTTQPMAPICNALHVALLVSDLTQAEQFYEQVLGLPPAPRALNFPGQWYQIGAFQIHLIVAEEHTAPIVNRDRWGRNPHLALAVADLAEMHHRLEAHQCPIQTSRSGRAALFTQDPDGNVIELSQLSP
ncbi:MAG: VOC family protein [Leptolyngbyaceae cyanobacterium]